MIQEKELPVAVPSMGKIVLATVVAMIVAAVILVVAVLPAEYGIDPLGTGKLLGLTDLAKASEKSAPPAAASGDTATAIINPVLLPPVNGAAPVMKNAFIAQPQRYKIDSREYTIPPHEGMEIKYHMNKGAGLVYSWNTDNTVTFEFHGEPNVKPAGAGKDYYETYELNDQAGKNQGSGTFIAPSTGIHGWFWENKSDKPVKLKLVSAGFYDWIMQNVHNKQAALKPMDPDSILGHPTIPDEPLR
jgi:hypothetical protein